MEIFVGNLPFTVDSIELTALFQQHGTVTIARIVTDKFSGQSRGFGFVIMPERDEAIAAIAAVSRQEFHGNRLNVSEARAQSRTQILKVEKT